MLKIDIHTHILPKELPNWAEKFGYGGFIQLDHHKTGCARMMRDDQFFREINANCWDPNTRIKECNADAVQVQVLSTVPIMFNYWTKPTHGLDVAKFLNDHIANIVQNHPKRFIGMATLPMQDPELACEEMIRCKEDLGLVGIEIGSHINDWNLSNAALEPFFATAEQIGMALFVHPWDMMGKEKMGEYWLPWLVGMPAETSLAICSMIFGGVFDRHPNLRVAFAHGGGAFPFTLGRIDHAYDVRPDLCAQDCEKKPSDYLGRFFVDSITHDAHAMQYLLDLFGEDAVALGSDYPFPLGEHHPGELIASMDVNQETKEKLYASNALQWLNLSAATYQT